MSNFATAILFLACAFVLIRAGCNMLGVDREIPRIRYLVGVVMMGVAPAFAGKALRVLGLLP